MSNDSSDDDFLSVSPALQKRLDAVQQQVNERLLSEARARQDAADASAARTHAAALRKNERYLKKHGKQPSGVSQNAVLAAAATSAAPIARQRKEFVLDPTTNKFYRTTVTSLPPSSSLAGNCVLVATANDSLAISEPPAAPSAVPITTALAARRCASQCASQASSLSTSGSATARPQYGPIAVAVHSAVATPLNLAAPGTGTLPVLAATVATVAAAAAADRNHAHHAHTRADIASRLTPPASPPHAAPRLSAAGAAAFERTTARAAACGQAFGSALWFPAPRPWPQRPTGLQVAPATGASAFITIFHHILNDLHVYVILYGSALGVASFVYIPACRCAQ